MKMLKQFSNSGGKNLIVVDNVTNPIMKILLKRQLPILHIRPQRKFLRRKSSHPRIKVHLFQRLGEYRTIILSSFMKPFSHSDHFISLVHLIRFWLLTISTVINSFFALMWPSIDCFLMFFFFFLKYTLWNMIHSIWIHNN